MRVLHSVSNICTEISEGVVPLIVGLSPVHVSDELGHLHPALSPPTYKDQSGLVPGGDWWCGLT